MQLNPLKALILAAALTLAALTLALTYMYPYTPTSPPHAIDANYTSQGLEEVVRSNNRLAVSLYAQLAAGDDNLLYSPLSIYSALAMVYEGARGTTADQFRSALGLPPLQALRPSYAHIYNTLNNVQNATLRVGNAIWVQKGFQVLPSYKETLEKYYAAKAANLDFTGAPEKARLQINSFIAQQTGGMIKQLIPPGLINPRTRLIITNAVYLKAAWLYPFNPNNTRPMDFHTPTGTVKAQMMCMKPQHTLPYADLPDAQVLQLPYAGNLTLTIILPKHDIHTLEKTLPQRLTQYLTSPQPTRLTKICIPKFQLQTAYDLKPPLQALGLTQPFTKNADLSGIDGKKDLYVQWIIHKARIQVDEQGTRAAASTAAGIGLTALPPGPTFTADKPFIFIITHRPTGLIIFIGRVTDPTAS